MENKYSIFFDMEGLEELWEDSTLKKILDALGEGIQYKFDQYISKIQLFSTAASKSFQSAGKNVVKAFQNIQQEKLHQQTQKQLQNLSGSLRRSLMGFDQINRLNKKTGSTTASIKKDLEDTLSTLFDTTGFFEKLGNDIYTALNGGVRPEENPLTWYEKIFQGLGQKTQENTGLLNIFASGWDALTGKFKNWYNEIAQGDSLLGQLIRSLQLSCTQADTTSEHFGTMGGNIRSHFLHTWQDIHTTWGGFGSWIATQVTAPAEKSFQGLWSNIRKDISGTYDHTKSTFSQVGKALTDSLSTAWSAVSDQLGEKGSLKPSLENGVLKGLKTSVNAIIQGLNTSITEPFSGLNAILDKLQKTKVGTTSPFSFLNWRVSVPKIPFLAQGAVLPANKPFLAMVGDQRNGTNIEAPLSTIQEAVALTMEDMAAGNMAGHAATVEVLRDILQAVLGISISDSTIANACARHQSNMAVVLGK